MTTTTPALLLEDSETHVIVHPLVLLSVLDHHSRRQEADGRVIGTLLGRRDGNKIEITNCFAVPHAERGDEVAIGKDFNKQMLALHLRGNPRETLMGWYASTAEPLIADTSSLIHEFYAGESEDGDPVHLVVDTRLLTDALPISAYKSTSVQIQGEALANLFHPVRLTFQSTESAAICLDSMMSKDTVNTNTIGLQASMETLLSLLETTCEHVEAVVNGTLPADPTVGRTIADTLAVIPKIRSFDKLFDDSLQDLLMVSYLSQITRTQLMVAQQLNASLGQI